MAVNESDALQAHLFECDEEGVFAVSLDRGGSNLPPSALPGGWRYVTDFKLGVQHPVPVPIAAEPILRGIRANGFFVWRMGAMHGTTQ